MSTTGGKNKERVIFIAVDGSEVSAEAFNTYVDVLKQEGDRVVLFTCMELKDVLDSFWKETVYTYDPELLRGKLTKEEAEAKARLQPLVDQLHQLGVKCKAVPVIAKDPGQEILEKAREEGACLIVLGCRGHGVIRRTLMGSCSDYVVNHSPVPVLVCRKS